MQVNAKSGRRALPGDSDVIWEAFLRGESPDTQVTVMGGETITFDNPDIDYRTLFDGAATEDQPQMMPGSPQPQNQPQPNPVFQGTGEIY